MRQVSFITNLAVADLLMGVYMIIIASADQYYNEYFPANAEIWRHGGLCKFAGFISILSSEASLFFITSIGIDRCWAFISFDFISTWVQQRDPDNNMVLRFFRFRKILANRRLFLRAKSKTCVTLLVWMFALLLSVVGIVLESEQDYHFSEVCVGLPLARKFITHPTFRKVTYLQDEFNYTGVGIFIKFGPPYFSKSEIVGTQPSSTYSLVVFLGINFFCCITVALCYICLFIHIKRSHASLLGTNLRMVFKMGLITLTDLMCWLPIIIIGVGVQIEKLQISPEVFAWIVGFVLPINSALNPFLYTIIGNTMFDCVRRTRHGNRYVQLDRTRTLGGIFIYWLHRFRELILGCLQWTRLVGTECEPYVVIDERALPSQNADVRYGLLYRFRNYANNRLRQMQASRNVYQQQVRTEETA